MHVVGAPPRQRAAIFSGLFASQIATENGVGFFPVQGVSFVDMYDMQQLQELYAALQFSTGLCRGEGVPSVCERNSMLGTSAFFSELLLLSATLVVVGY